MFYFQCWKCGERWNLGTASTCTCEPEQNPLTSIDYVPCCTDQTCPKCKATTPPQRPWVGLTYKEVQEIHDTYHKRMGPQEFASMIEAKLRSKNEHL